MFRSRLAPALRVFQTLESYPIIRPRHLDDVPIGCSSPDSLTIHTAQQSLQSLYHDLGVLVFAGASAKQTERIGDILRHVVASGGPGAMSMRLTSRSGVEDGYERLVVLEGDLYDPVDASRPGQIKPEVILRLASSRLRGLLQDRIDHVKLIRPDLQSVHIQEMGVLISGLSARGGTQLPSETGLRQLSLDSFASIGIGTLPGRAAGEVRFYAVGTGDFVGAAKIDYRVLHFDEKEKRMKTLWWHKILQKREPDSTIARDRLGEAKGVLGKLWELEREIWADRVTGKS